MFPVVLSASSGFAQSGLQELNNGPNNVFSYGLDEPIVVDSVQPKILVEVKHQEYYFDLSGFHENINKPDIMKIFITFIYIWNILIEKYDDIIN